MNKLADLDTSFLVPCAHCDALFQEGERFCPSCGEDQLFSVAAPARAALPAAGRAAAQGVGWLRPRVDDVADAGLDTGAPLPLDEHSTSGHRGRSGSARNIGIALVLVVAAAAVAIWGFDRYGTLGDTSGRQRTYEITVDQLRAALDRGDTASAERLFGTLDATQLGSAGVIALKQDLDQRLLEQAQRRAQLSNAASNASRAIGFGEVAPPDANAAIASSSASAASATVPAPPSSPAAPQKDCNDALAALALCKPQ